MTGEAEPTELGATPTRDGTRFAAWSTVAKSVAVRIFANADTAIRTEPLTARPGGSFEAVLPGVGPGALYKFVLERSWSGSRPSSHHCSDGPGGPRYRLPLHPDYHPAP